MAKGIASNKSVKKVKKQGVSIKIKLIISYISLAVIPLVIVNLISMQSFKKNLRDNSMELTT